MNVFATILTAILCLAPHGDLHKKIQDLDRRIAAQPRSVELRLMRGEFLRLHGEHIKALRDYQTAEYLDPQGTSVHLLKGQLFYDMKRHGAAAKALALFLKANPRSPEGLRAKARNEIAQGNKMAAIAVYRRLLKINPSNVPDDILACARLMRTTDELGANSAVEFLDRELKARGPLIVLELEALEIEKAAKRFKQALGRIDRLAANARRPDLWDVRRAAVYRASGDVQAELQCWQRARANLARLPLHVRRRPATVAQTENVKKEIQRLTRQKGK